MDLRGTLHPDDDVPDTLRDGAGPPTWAEYGERVEAALREHPAVNDGDCAVPRIPAEHATPSLLDAALDAVRRALRRLKRRLRRARRTASQ